MRIFRRLLTRFNQHISSKVLQFFREPVKTTGLCNMFLTLLETALIKASIHFLFHEMSRQAKSLQLSSFFIINPITSATENALTFGREHPPLSLYNTTENLLAVSWKVVADAEAWDVLGPCITYHRHNFLTRCNIWLPGFERILLTVDGVKRAGEKRILCTRKPHRPLPFTCGARLGLQNRASGQPLAGSL